MHNKEVVHREAQASVGIGLLTLLSAYLGNKWGKEHEAHSERTNQMAAEHGAPTYSPLTHLITNLVLRPFLGGVGIAGLGSVADYTAHEIGDVELGLHFWDTAPFTVGAATLLFVLRNTHLLRR